MAASEFAPDHILLKPSKEEETISPYSRLLSAKRAFITRCMGRVKPTAFGWIRPDGRPVVKIATSEQGSGLTLGRGVDPTYIALEASGGDASLSLMNKERCQQLIKA